MEKHTSNGTTMDLEMLESPFLSLTNFKQPAPATYAQNTIAVPSPFKSVYELNGMEEDFDTEQEGLVEIMNDLYDAEFDDMLKELAIEGQVFIKNEMPSGTIQNERMVEDKLRQHFAPLDYEFDKFIDYAINAIEQKGDVQITEIEFEGLFENYSMEGTADPMIENFLKKAWKKLKKTGAKAIKYAKKGVKKLANLALKHIMKVFKKLFPFLMKLAYKMGLFKKIPKKYRFITNKILKKLGVDIKKAYSKNELHYEQQEVDMYIANVLMANSPEELELVDKDFDGIFEDEVVLDYERLDMENSRMQFVNSLQQLNPEESTKPIIDEFVSAIILASKFLGGRTKAVSFMGKHLGAFFAKWLGVNKKSTTKFAKHLLDKGLSKFGFEVAPNLDYEAGFEAIATVIERTTQEIAQLPDTSLENEALLEDHIVHAFERMASSYLPDILRKEHYENRPDLKEAFTKKVAWVKKKNGKRKRHCGFNKLNEELEINLTPYVANKVKTFGGNSLYQVLNDQFGVHVNKETPATLHLYETAPETDRQEIIYNDEVFNKYGNLPPGIISKQLFPLTSIASGLLLGEPALGCKCRSNCLNKNMQRNGRHRYYYLEIPGAFPQVYTTISGIQSLRNTTNLKVKLNFIKNQISLSQFLSETEAQKIASEIRQHRKENASILINTIIKSGIYMAFSKHTTQHMNIVHPKVLPGNVSGESFNLVPRKLQETLRDKLVGWTTTAITNHLLSNSEQFIKSVDDGLDGISIEIGMKAPNGFQILKGLIGQNKVQLTDAIFSDKKLETAISIKPGTDYV